MDVIEQARKLGAEIQKDERFIAYAKAKLANDSDEGLQKAIGEFNLVRMQLDGEMNAEPRDEEKVKQLNDDMRRIYGEVMSSSSMTEYNTAKAEVDHMLNDINSIIMMCVEGEDPETCEIHEHDCGGNCSSCGGCH